MPTQNGENSRTQCNAQSALQRVPECGHVLHTVYSITCLFNASVKDHYPIITYSSSPNELFENVPYHSYFYAVVMNTNKWVLQRSPEYFINIDSPVPCAHHGQSWPLTLQSAERLFPSCAARLRPRRGQNPSSECTPPPTGLRPRRTDKFRQFSLYGP